MRKDIEKTRDSKGLKQEEQIRTNLESCIAHYAPEYPTNDMGKEAVGYVESKLKERYGSLETDNIMKIMREAFVVRDYYAGKLNAKMRLLDELDFSKVTNNKLYSRGMSRLGDIAKYSRRDLYKMGFGQASVNIIEDKLVANGLKLKGFSHS